VITNQQFITFSSFMHKLTDATGAARLLQQAQDRLAQITGVTAIDAEPDTWLIDMGDGNFVAQWSTPWCRLILTADLGCVTASAERTTLSLSLSVNALWHELGHLRLARDGDEGALLLIGALGPEDSDPDTFNASLLHFEAMRQWCIEAIATVGSPPPPLPPNASLLRI
jgi:hypothetical protein